MRLYTRYTVPYEVGHWLRWRRPRLPTAPLSADSPPGAGLNSWSELAVLAFSNLSKEHPQVAEGSVREGASPTYFSLTLT
jgi:hypothetical protein